MSLQQENTQTPITDQVSQSLENWGKTLSQLEQKAKTTEASTRESMSDFINGLKKKKENFESQWSKIKSTGDDAAQDLKEGFQKSYNALNQSFRDAESKFL